MESENSSMAALACFRASVELTRADSDIRSPLLQVLFDLLRLADQEGNVTIRGVRKPHQDARRLLELFDKLRVLLIAPGLPKLPELRLQHRHLVAKLRAQPLEVLGKPPEFRRIDYRLGHAKA